MIYKILLILMVGLLFAILCSAEDLMWIDTSTQPGLLDSTSPIIIEMDGSGAIEKIRINKGLLSVGVTEDENWYTIILDDKCAPIEFEPNLDADRCV